MEKYFLFSHHIHFLHRPPYSPPIFASSSIYTQPLFHHRITDPSSPPPYHLSHHCRLYLFYFQHYFFHQILATAIIFTSFSSYATTVTTLIPISALHHTSSTSITITTSTILHSSMPLPLSLCIFHFHHYCHLNLFFIENIDWSTWRTFNTIIFNLIFQTRYNNIRKFTVIKHFTTLRLNIRKYFCANKRVLAFYGMLKL